MNEDLRNTVRLMLIDSKTAQNPPLHVEVTRALFYFTYWSVMLTVLFGCVYVFDVLIKVWPQ